MEVWLLYCGLAQTVRYVHDVLLGSSGRPFAWQPMLSEYQRQHMHWTVDALMMYISFSGSTYMQFYHLLAKVWEAGLKADEPCCKGTARSVTGVLICTYWQDGTQRHTRGRHTAADEPCCKCKSRGITSVLICIYRQEERVQQSFARGVLHSQICTVQLQRCQL